MLALYQEYSTWSEYINHQSVNSKVSPNSFRMPGLFALITPLAMSKICLLLRCPQLFRSGAHSEYLACLPFLEQHHHRSLPYHKTQFSICDVFCDRDNCILECYIFIILMELLCKNGVYISQNSKLSFNYRDCRFQTIQLRK